MGEKVMKVFDCLTPAKDISKQYVDEWDLGVDSWARPKGIWIHLDEQEAEYLLHDFMNYMKPLIDTRIPRGIAIALSRLEAHRYESILFRRFEL